MTNIGLSILRYGEWGFAGRTRWFALRCKISDGQRYDWQNSTWIPKAIV